VRPAILAVVCAAFLVAAGAASASSPQFGVAEDMTKYADDGGASLYPRIRAVGMTENRITVRWNPYMPTTIQERGFLDRALPAASRAGVRIVFDVIPAEASTFAADTGTRVTLFAAYLQTLARTYPQVRDFVIANEPNEAYFWQPQFDNAGLQASGAAFERLLAASYDALKAVDPAIRVIAAGPSNEGNDRKSTSPVRFIDAFGKAYRASGRTAPVMDALGFHVYPRVNTDSPSRPYSWPNAGGVDLARVKQAVWDAFSGTAQPTFAEGAADPATGLRLVVDEFGWQAEIGPALAHRYTGVENVPTVTEAEQADDYRSVIRVLSCDPAVSDAMVFHLVDERDLGRFQSGLLRVDLSERPAYAAVRAAIAAAGSCDAPALWAHTTGVVGAKAIFGARDQPARQAIFGISVTAGEDAYAKAGIFRVSGPNARPRRGDIDRSLAAADGPRTPTLDTAKAVQANITPRLEFNGRLAPGHYVFAVRLVAAMNPARSQTFVSRTFRIRS
jgi:hypothetical protein